MARLEVFVVAVVLLGSCQAMQSIADTISTANQTQFLAALQKALDQNLIDLSTGGPYTILVPTDDAFSKLTTEELNNVLNEADALRDVLKYHILQGEVFSWDLPDGRILTTLNGHSVRVYATGQSTYFNSGRVVKADLEANNAVIHLIDAVLDVPEGTIYEVLRNPEYQLSTFADYVDKVRLNHTLDSNTQHKYTVFAPSNDAFSRLSPVILERIQVSSSYMRELVTYHIHQGTLHVRSLDRNGTVSTMDSYHKIHITVDTDIHLNERAMLEQVDIDCDNGVVHIIDHVLIPSSLGSIIG